VPVTALLPVAAAAAAAGAEVTPYL
jgi:hypothetical protein